MDLQVEGDLVRVTQMLTKVKTRLDTPMAVGADSSDRERIAALADAVTMLTQIVTKIARNTKHSA